MQFHVFLGKQEQLANPRPRTMRPRHRQLRSTHSSDEACACLHRAQSCVSNLDGKDLSTRSNAIPFRLFGKMPGSDTSYVCSVGS